LHRKSGLRLAIPNPHGNECDRPSIGRRLRKYWKPKNFLTIGSRTDYIQRPWNRYHHKVVSIPIQRKQVSQYR
jgi:hypothetical protein